MQKVFIFGIIIPILFSGCVAIPIETEYGTWSINEEKTAKGAQTVKLINVHIRSLISSDTSTVSEKSQENPQKYNVLEVYLTETYEVNYLPPVYKKRVNFHKKLVVGILPGLGSIAWANESIIYNITVGAVLSPVGIVLLPLNGIMILGPTIGSWYYESNNAWEPKLKEMSQQELLKKVVMDEKFRGRISLEEIERRSRNSLNS